MKAGLFLMPSHPPERSTYDALQWDLDTIAFADQLGYAEAWIGEHFTAPWEPVPTPDLMVAQALMRTKNIKLGPGSHLLPFHHPVELAHRVAYLDHMAQGRYMFGIGAGGFPTDMALFDVDTEANQHREMTRESLDIILKLWASEGAFEYKGKFWNVTMLDPKDFEYATLKRFLNPYQKPHPPIGVASASPGSETLKLAGERGFIPMSLGLNPKYLASHWEAVEEGAERAGRKPPSRSEWRIVRDMWIADTDEEAREQAINGMLGRAWREYLIPLFTYGPNPLVTVMKHDESLPDEAVTVEYLTDNLWLVGSPKTVAVKIRDLYEVSGGFGVLLPMVVDHKDQNEAWQKCMRLLMEEVLSQLSCLNGE